MTGSSPVTSSGQPVVRGWRFLLPLGYMALLLSISSIPGTPRPDEPASYALFRWVPPHVQNLLHLPEYALLAWLWCRALDASGTRAGYARTLAAAAISITFAFVDEAYQMTEAFINGEEETV